MTFDAASTWDVAGGRAPLSHDWWEPYALGVGPAGADVASLDEDHREALREACFARLGDGPGAIEATAWLAVAAR